MSVSNTPRQTVERVFGIDPRPDADDTAVWTAVLRLSAAYDGDHDRGIHAALFSARATGAIAYFDAEADRVRIAPAGTARQYWPAMQQQLQECDEPLLLLLRLAGTLPVCREAR